ncbi:MAG: LPS export ABC transporter periplasmic protein LptC [Deltaproteobacteria bacterium]
MTSRSLCLCAAALLFSAAAAAAEPQQSVAPGQMETFSLSGYSEKGKKNWDISGKSADIDSRVIKLDNVQSTMYGDNSTVHLTAQKGDFDRQAGKVHLEKDVVVTTSDGTKMTTDQLNWDKKEQVVSTPSQVNILKQDMVITGQGAYGRTDLNKMDLQKDVKVNIAGNARRPGQTEGPTGASANPITIRCDGPLQIDYASDTAVFNTNVNVLTGDCRIESDRMDVFFLRSRRDKAQRNTGFAGSKIERIVAKGNVKITRNEDVSYCEEATYTAADRKVSLSGSPRLVIYPTEEQGASAGDKRPQ